MIYTVEKVTLEHLNDEKLVSFFINVGAAENQLHGSLYDWSDFPLKHYIQNYRMTLARKDGEPVGVLLARLYASLFDRKIQILKQDLLFVLPGSHRATKMLLDDFIDFGKANADHILTMIGEQTNIKERSLERLGFKRIEVLYRMETKNGSRQRD